MAQWDARLMLYIMGLQIWLDFNHGKHWSLLDNQTFSFTGVFRIQ